MACYNTSLNRMVFLICIPFIIVSIGVHLSSIFIILPPIVPSSNYSNPCIDLLHNIEFHENTTRCVTSPIDDKGCQKTWSWMKSKPIAKCGFKKLEKPKVSVMLNRSWVVFAGDSQTRLGMVSFLKLVELPKRVKKVRRDLHKLRTDYSTFVESIGMKLEFRWKPYARRLINLTLEFKKNKKTPDIIVMGAGLWDMLYETNMSDYGVTLRGLRNYLQDLKGKDGRVPHLFWLAMPCLVNSKMASKEKRHTLTEPRRIRYDEKINESKVLKKFGGPLLKLDMHFLSELCGPQCTQDGLHYDEVVYDIVVQILLNSMLVESTHKPHI